MSVSFEGIREDFFSELMAWAAECGASCDGFEISNFADEGYGLKATKDIKVGVFPHLVRRLFEDKLGESRLDNVFFGSS